MAEDYSPDTYTEPDEKNEKLSRELRGLWNTLSIKIIRRVETDGRHGWEIEYDD